MSRLIPRGVVVAGLGRRFIAAVLDWLPFGVIYGLQTLLALTVITTNGQLLASTIIAAVLGAGYGLYQWWAYASRGAGLGARVMGIRLVSMKDGEPIGWWRFFLRQLVFSALMGTFVGGIALLVFLVIHERRQGWHDMVAGAVVVQPKESEQRATAPTKKVAQTTTVGLPPHLASTFSPQPGSTSSGYDSQAPDWLPGVGGEPFGAPAPQGSYQQHGLGAQASAQAQWGEPPGQPHQPPWGAPGAQPQQAQFGTPQFGGQAASPQAGQPSFGGQPAGQQSFGGQSGAQDQASFGAQFGGSVPSSQPGQQSFGGQPGQFGAPAAAPHAGQEPFGGPQAGQQSSGGQPGAQGQASFGTQFGGPAPSPQPGATGIPGVPPTPGFPGSGQDSPGLAGGQQAQGQGAPAGVPQHGHSAPEQPVTPRPAAQNWIPLPTPSSVIEPARQVRVRQREFGDVDADEGTRITSLPDGAAGRAGDEGWYVRLDDGREVDLAVTVLLGRNPQKAADDPAEVHLVPASGDGRMISRTHVLIGTDPRGVYVVDRGSTNGTALVTTGGDLEPCPSGTQVRVREGQQVSYGNRWFTILRRPVLPA